MPAIMHGGGGRRSCSFLPGGDGRCGKDSADKTGSTTDGGYTFCALLIDSDWDPGPWVFPFQFEGKPQ